MEQKKRLFIVVAVTVLIAGAIFTSFGRTLLTLNTPPVVLPDLSVDTDTPPPDGSPQGGGGFETIQVTPKTVQGVIATLYRPDSYYRELNITTSWRGGSSQVLVQQWEDAGWSHTRQVLASGMIRHDLVGDGQLYYWYEGDTDYQVAPAAPLDADLAQRIPTYETVLELEGSAIQEADYQLWSGLPCIYVAVGQGDVLLRFWISVDNGLLMAAQAEEQGSVFYEMSAAGALQSPCPPTSAFELPDGTVMHNL